MDVKITKESLFSEPGNGIYKGSQGPAKHFGSSAVVELNTSKGKVRKTTNNYTVKMKATKGREMKTSKSGKIGAQPTHSLDLDPSV